MLSKNEFQKALRYLDFGKNEKGQVALKNAIYLAEQEGDTITLISASCCYGELLYNMGRKSEAKIFLEKVVFCDVNTDLINYEIRRAKELLLDI